MQGEVKLSPDFVRPPQLFPEDHVIRLAPLRVPPTAANSKAMLFRHKSPIPEGSEPGVPLRSELTPKAGQKAGRCARPD
jgi:hypothetical protein